MVQITDETFKSIVATLQAIKLRIHFIGWPKEPMFFPGIPKEVLATPPDSDQGHVSFETPDWRKEIALLESTLSDLHTYEGKVDGPKLREVQVCSLTENVEF